MALNHDGSTSGHVDPITNDQFQQLLSAISSTQQKMEDRLCLFRQELVSSQEESTVKALKRARYDKALRFRKKGNEEQHKFNERLGTELENVTAELEHAVETPAIARAKDSLKTGMAMLAKRQKHIRIADRSEFGWGVVAEYEADELADGSDDEKRLEKAEKSAERRAFKLRKKIPTTSASLNAGPTGLSSAGLPPPPPLITPVVHYTGFRLGGITQRSLLLVGPCFTSGEMGHLKRACPKAIPGPAGTKWYPPSKVNGTNSEPSVHGNCVEVPISDHSIELYGLSDELGVEEPIDSPDNSCFWEADTESLSDPNPVIVTGRLKEHLAFWKNELKAPSFVIETIERGYRLPLKSVPSQYCQANAVSAINNASLLMSPLLSC